MRVPRRRFYAVLTLFVLFLAAGTVVAIEDPASAAGTTVSTDDQLWVERQHPDTTLNHCTLWSLANGSATATKRIIVSFNTSGVVPGGNTLTGAVLRVYPRATYTGNVDVYTYPRTNPGCNVTWNNQQPFGAKVGSSTGGFTKNVYKSITLNPTAVLTNARTGLLVGAQVPSDLQFQSDAGTNMTKLDLTWAPTPTTTTTTTTSTTTTTTAPTTTTTEPPTTTTEPPTTTTEPPTTTTTPPPPPCTGVTILDGADIQAALNANPPGTFCIEGFHRLPTDQPISPGAGDTLKGVGTTATIDGSKVITGWAPSGSNWIATASLPPTPGTDPGECQVAGCTLREDMFRDGAPLLRVLSSGAVGPGKFFANYTTNQIVVGDDPNGHLMEQNDARRLVAGSVTNVTVTNLILQHTANGGFDTVVDPLGTGSTGWVVSYTDTRYNHGVGLGGDQEGGHYTLAHNNIHHNGEAGVGGNGPVITLDSNEIHHNNMASYQGGEWYDTLWSGGGGKFGGPLSYDHVVTGNYSHDNIGPGLWCDINCGHATVTGNDFRNNNDIGYFYEISYGNKVPGDGLKTVIANNTTVGNGLNPDPPSGGGGIVVSASPDVEVYGNTSCNDLRGIVGWQQTRTDSPDPRGPHEIRNLDIHNNNVNLNGTGPGFGGKVGIFQDNGTFTYSPAYNNHYTANAYHHTNTGTNWFWWDAAFKTFPQWQAVGHDATGSITADNPACPPPPAPVVGPQASGGGGGPPAPEPGRTVADCLVDPTTDLNGTQTVQFRVNAPPAGQTYDLRDAVWNNYPSGSPAISRFGPWMVGHNNNDGFGRDNCVLGPRINGTLALDVPVRDQYTAYHGGPYIAGDDVAGNTMTLIGGRTERIMDCVRMNGTKPPAAVVIKHVYCVDILDDFIENDLNPTTLTVYDSLYEGFNGISERPDASNPWVNPNPPAETTLVQKVLIHLKPMGSDHESCAAFKWDSESTENLRVEDSTFWYEQASTSLCSGALAQSFPAGMTAANSKIVWSGSGDFPFRSAAEAAGFTVLNEVDPVGIAGPPTWQTARDDWCSRHAGVC